METETTTTTTTETQTSETAEKPVETTAATTETTVAADTKPEGETLLDGKGEPEGAAKQQPEGAGASLLDDAKPEDQGAADAPTEDQVKAFTDGLHAIDLGEGVRIDDAALKAVTPELMKVAGNDPKKAEGVVRAYVEWQRGQARAAAERDDAFNRGLVAQCRERYGEDLGKVVALAKKGGAAIFGDRIWNEMKRVPSFANNPDIIGKLAEFGRRVATDDGKVTPVGAPPSDDRGDVLHRMYGSVKV